PFCSRAGPAGGAVGVGDGALGFGAELGDRLGKALDVLGGDAGGLGQFGDLGLRVLVHAISTAIECPDGISPVLATNSSGVTSLSFMRYFGPSYSFGNGRSE